MASVVRPKIMTVAVSLVLYRIPRSSWQIPRMTIRVKKSALPGMLGR